MQLPRGIELLSVEVKQTKFSPQPYSAKYVLTVQSQYLNEPMKSRIRNLLEHKRLDISRRINADKSKIKGVNIRPFLKSIDLNDEDIEIECRIDSSGSVRVQEILQLLELDVNKLTAPIRRTNIQWKEN